MRNLLCQTRTRGNPVSIVGIQQSINYPAGEFDDKIRARRAVTRAGCRLTAPQRPCRRGFYYKNGLFRQGRREARVGVRWRYKHPLRGRASRQDSSAKSTHIAQIAPTNLSGARLNDFPRNFKSRKRSRSCPRTPSLARQASMLAIGGVMIMASHFLLFQQLPGTIVTPTATLQAVFQIVHSLSMDCQDRFSFFLVGEDSSALDQ